MDRREFIAGSAAAAATAMAPIGEVAAAAFSSKRFSVVTRGGGPDVLLIPGLTNSREVWSGLTRALPGYRYHLFQIAGFAGDPVGGNASGPVLEPLAADVARYITAHGVGAPAIIGHSMGGTLAMMVAARHPRVAGRVMVVDMLPAPAGLFGATAASVRPLADVLLGSLTSTPGGQRLLQQFMNGGGSSRANSDSNLVARVTHELAVTDLTDDLAKIRAPLTIVYATARPDGTVDPEVTARSYQRAYRNAAGAKLVRVANSGHMIMYDQPARFQAAVKEFLATRG